MLHALMRYSRDPAPDKRGEQREVGYLRTQLHLYCIALALGLVRGACIQPLALTRSSCRQPRAVFDGVRPSAAAG